MIKYGFLTAGAKGVWARGMMMKEMYLAHTMPPPALSLSFTQREHSRVFFKKN